MYTRTPAMTSFFVSSPFVVLVDELAAADDDTEETELESCILDEDFAELDVDVEGPGFSSWFLSFSRRCFKYNVLFNTDSDLWCPVVVDSTCSAPKEID